MKHLLDRFGMLPTAAGMVPSYSSGMISRAAIVLVTVSAALLGLSSIHREPVAARGDIAITHPWSKGASLDRRALAAYLTIENKSGHPDKLLRAESPLAERILIDRFWRNRRSSQTIEVSDLEVGPQTRLIMRPGKMQITLYGLRAAVQPGDTVPLSLLFERAGKLDVTIKVENLGEPEHADHF